MLISHGHPVDKTKACVESLACVSILNIVIMMTIDRAGVLFRQGDWTRLTGPRPLISCVYIQGQEALPIIRTHTDDSYKPSPCVLVYLLQEVMGLLSLCFFFNVQ